MLRLSLPSLPDDYLFLALFVASIAGVDLHRPGENFRKRVD